LVTVPAVSVVVAVSAMLAGARKAALFAGLVRLAVGGVKATEMFTTEEVVSIPNESLATAVRA
jgi:hypothetical protein